MEPKKIKTIGGYKILTSSELRIRLVFVTLFECSILNKETTPPWATQEERNTFFKQFKKCSFVANNNINPIKWN